MTDGQKLRQFIENQPKSIKSIYTALGLSKQGFYNYFDSITMEDDTKKKIEKYFGKSIFGEKVNIDPEKKNAPQGDFKANTEGQNHNAQMDSLIESNRMMAAAMLTDAENRARLTRSNETLTSMVLQSASVQPKKSLDEIAKASEFLALIAEIGSGKKLWHSKSEGLARLSKFVPVHDNQTSKTDIRDGLGK